jgi:hypothetical protein
VNSVRAGDGPSWAEIVRIAEHGESVSVIADGDHVAGIVPSGGLNRLGEAIEVLSETGLVLDLREGLADARGAVFSAGQTADDPLPVVVLADEWRGAYVIMSLQLPGVGWTGSLGCGYGAVRIPGWPRFRNPHRLDNPLDPLFEAVWTTVRGDYRALYV